MDNINENKNDEKLIFNCSNDLKALISTKDKKAKERLVINLIETEEKLLKSKNEEDVARSAIINFIVKNSSTKDLLLKELINEFTKIFTEKSVINDCANKLDNKFEEPSPFKMMISFRKNVKKEKKYLEFYFKVMIIQQNIPDILKGIQFLLNINNKTIENQFNKLNFQNPYAIILMRDLINILIIEENTADYEVILKNVKDYFKIYYLFRCPKCLAILHANYLGGIQIICAYDKVPFYPKDIKEMKDYLNIKINCKSCEKKIEIYENNYKCLKCKEFFCQDCSEAHKNNDIQNILINTYEIGFICEEHLELFSTFCALCKTNLCETCKKSHPHKVGQKIYEINENLIETNIKKDIEKSRDIYEYISTILSFNYNYMKHFSYNNLYIRTSIWFKEKFKRIDPVGDYKFYFNQFFDKLFQNYYSEILRNVSEGKSEYYKLLLLIKQKYDECKTDTDSSYYYFKENYLEKKAERINDYNDLIRNIRETCVWMNLNNQILRLDSDNIKLNCKLESMQTDIELLKLKILALLKSNNLYTSYLMKLINRYLADSLIRKIIQRYPDNFKKIEISYKNFYEIANNFWDILFKNNHNL